MKEFIRPLLIESADYDLSFAMGCPKSYVSSCGIGYRN